MPYETSPVPAAPPPGLLGVDWPPGQSPCRMPSYLRVTSLISYRNLLPCLEAFQMSSSIHLAPHQACSVDRSKDRGSGMDRPLLPVPVELKPYLHRSTSLSSAVQSPISSTCAYRSPLSSRCDNPMLSNHTTSRYFTREYGTMKAQSCSRKVRCPEKPSLREASTPPRALAPPKPVFSSSRRRDDRTARILRQSDPR